MEKVEGIQPIAQKRSSRFSRQLRKVFPACVVVACLIGHSTAARSEVEVLHTYGNSLGQEVISVVAVDASKLRPLLPSGYQLVPASSVGFGQADQGVVVVGNFRGIDYFIDTRTNVHEQVAIDLVILVNEPIQASQAGVSITGAFHVYTLGIYTNDPQYAASFLQTGFPIEYVSKIEYRREMDDATGVGNLSISVPSKLSPFGTFSTGQGYSRVAGAFNTVFWHDSRKGKTILHFLDEPFSQGTAISQIYTKPGSKWDTLFSGGGLGPCAAQAGTGYHCITAPALNMRYDEGTRGTLMIAKESDALTFRTVPGN
jgi:hypothetical protein